MGRSGYGNRLPNPKHLAIGNCANINALETNGSVEIRRRYKHHTSANNLSRLDGVREKTRLPHLQIVGVKFRTYFAAIFHSLQFRLCFF